MSAADLFKIHPEPGGNDAPPFYKVEILIRNEYSRVIEAHLRVKADEGLRGGLDSAMLRHHWDTCRRIMNSGHGYVQVRAIEEDLKKETSRVGRLVAKHYGRSKALDDAAQALKRGYAVNATEGLFLHTCLSLAVVRICLKIFNAYWELPPSAPNEIGPDWELMHALYYSLKDPEVRTRLTAERAIFEAVGQAAKELGQPNTSRNYVSLNIERAAKIIYDIDWLPQKQSDDQDVRVREDGRVQTLAEDWWETLLGGIESRRQAKREPRDAHHKEQMDRFRKDAEADARSRNVFSPKG